MFEMNISVIKKNIIICMILVLAVFAVFGQVNQFDFISMDDDVYVTDNLHIQSGITVEGLRWALTTRYFDLWTPLVWISFMLDYQLYDLHAGGYHVTNVMLHIISAVLLFFFFNRMTGSVWGSAFIAAFFALHPLRVESVAYIAERKDVLSLFFGILTLYLYVYYTEKASIQRYLTVLFCFGCGLMSKPMMVTLPLVMVLLDYWPLRRFELQKDNVMVWQLKEKTLFFVLSAVIAVITIYNPNGTSDPNVLMPWGDRIANATVALVTYVETTVWPRHPVALFDLSAQRLSWMVPVSASLILVMSLGVIVTMKRFPYLFVGWLWYIITIAPVTGIIQIGPFGSSSISDRYTYLPSIGIGMIITWGIPALMKDEFIRRRILFPAAIIFLTVMSILAWQQCGYWKNSFKLADHNIKIAKNNNAVLATAHLLRARAYFRIASYHQALEDFNEVVRLLPHCADCYYNRGVTYSMLGQQSRAIDDFNAAIRLIPNYVYAYYYRGHAYAKLGMQQRAIEDYQKIISFGFFQHQRE